MQFSHSLRQGVTGMRIVFDGNRAREAGFDFLNPLLRFH
jgi:hypothetical protein